MKKTTLLLGALLVSGAFILGQNFNNEKVIEETMAQDEMPAIPELVRADGTYPTIPLEKDVVVLKVIQSGVNSLSDFPSIEEGLEANLKHMESLADQACTTGKKPDFLLFHEFPLTGYSSGTRTEKLPFTIQIPGKESDRLGEIAKSCDTYVIFGTYATDDDWPNHILSINAVINREGKVVKKFWKPRNIKRLYPDREITTTTIEAVRDKYRAMYGIEEEFPVLQTEFGNISVSTVQFDPFIYAAYAMRGTEIMLRTATLFDEADVIDMAYINNFYSAMSNIAFPINPTYEGGESLIVDPKLNILAKDPTMDKDGVIEAEIPIAEFRKNRRIPNYAYEMVRPIFEQYKQEIPINHLDMPTEELPETGVEMKELFDRISRYIGENAGK